MTQVLEKDIPHEECVIRALKHDYHVKRGRVRWKAFEPPKGDSRISVVRYALGSDQCKQQAREIARNEHYWGVASVRAGDLLKQGFGVTDERDGHYIGHAEIDMGIRTPMDDEPEDPDVRKALKDRCEVILKMAQHLQDPDPESERWLGPPMCK